MDLLILALVSMILLFAWGEDSDNDNKKIDALCKDLLNEQVTLVDSIAVAEKHNDCLWINKDEEDNEQQ